MTSTPAPASALLTAWAAANAELTNPTKDARGNYGGYLTLDQLLDTVRPIYTAHGLVWWQTIKCANGVMGITTHVAHTSGERLSFGTMTAPQPTNPQQIGSVRTYLSRYSYMTAMGIAPGDDDDGQAASAKPKAKTQAAPAAPAVTMQRKADKPKGEDAKPDANAGQRRMMFALFKELHVTERDDMLRYCSDVAGRVLESSNDLTGDELSKVLSSLTADKAAQDGDK